MEDRAKWGSHATLPSRGLLYGDSLPEGKVICSPWVGDEEEMLATVGPGQGEFVINALIAQSVFDGDGERIQGLHPADFLIGDRVYLMQVGRCVTHGAAHQFDLDCMVCRKPFSATVNVPDDLQIVSLPDGFTEPFFYTADFSKVRFECRLLRGRDLIAMQEFRDKHATAAVPQQRGPMRGPRQAPSAVSGDVAVITKRDPSHWYRLVRQVVAIEFPESLPQFIEIYGQRLVNDGTPETEQRFIQLFRMMVSGDTNGLRNFLDETDCGPNTLREFQCPRCKYTFDATIPGGAEFFRPRARTGVANF